MTENMTPAAPRAKQRDNYVMLTADSLELLLPQHKVNNRSIWKACLKLAMILDC